MALKKTLNNRRLQIKHVRNRVFGFVIENSISDEFDPRSLTALAFFDCHLSCNNEHEKHCFRGEMTKIFKFNIIKNAPYLVFYLSTGVLSTDKNKMSKIKRLFDLMWNKYNLTCYFSFH